MKLTAVAVVVLLTAGIAQAKDDAMKKQAGEYEVEVRIEKPSIGVNLVTIGVQDRSGRQVTDAKVSAEYWMARGIDVPPMDNRAEAVLEGTVYRAMLTFPMAGAGAGEIVVHITRGSESAAARFNIDVH